MVYMLTFDDPIIANGPSDLRRIEHVSSGDFVTLDQGIGIDSTFELVNAWSDTQAEVQKGQARKFKLAVVFQKPYGLSWKVSWSGNKCCKWRGLYGSTYSNNSSIVQNLSLKKIWICPTNVFALS